MYIKARITIWLVILSLAAFIIFFSQKAYGQVPEDFKRGFLSLGKQYGPIMVSVCMNEEEAKKVLAGKTNEEQQDIFTKSPFCDNVIVTFVPVKVLHIGDIKIVLIKQPNGDATRAWLTTLKVKKGESI